MYRAHLFLPVQSDLIIAVKLQGDRKAMQCRVHMSTTKPIVICMQYIRW